MNNPEPTEVLLRIENLCQYFKMSGKSELKAVDNVSFDIKKGEVVRLRKNYHRTFCDKDIRYHLRQCVF